MNPSSRLQARPSGMEIASDEARVTRKLELLSGNFCGIRMHISSAIFPSCSSRAEWMYVIALAQPLICSKDLCSRKITCENSLNLDARHGAGENK